MPLFSPNRRRAIVLLLLTSVLLLTLDLRGNAAVNRARSAFSVVLDPFVTASDVIATPIKNAWHGATDYQDLQRENEELRAELEASNGDRIAARAVISAYQEIIALQGLVANYPRVTARVVGDRTSNFSQTIEIDKGDLDGIKAGMAVISAAGLVGKITKVYPTRSVVRLITDSEYTIECKVTGVPDLDPFTGEPNEENTDTESTVPSGMSESDLTSTTTTVAPSTTTTTAVGGSTAESGSGTTTTSTSTGETGTGGTDGTDGTDDTATDGGTTTTTEPELVVRETGGCQGRGADRLPVMRFVTENPAFSEIQPGDVIYTAGGSTSLVPPDLSIGVVINRIERTNSSGPLLEIELAADLDHLNFVQVVQYQPTVEASD